MQIGKTLNLKDYRIIKFMLANQNPTEYVEDIGLELVEIELRIKKIQTFLGGYLKIN